MKVDEFVKQMRGYESDHSPDGWPAIRMRDISRLCWIVERQREALAEVATGPETMLAVMREKNIAITDLKDPMQKFAFTVYAELVGNTDIAREALNMEVHP